MPTPASASNENHLLLLCAAPAAAFLAAFWLLPAIRLLMLPASTGWQTYFIVLTDSKYFGILLNTLLLSLLTTAATLVLGAAVGLTLARHHLPGKALLLSLLTLPLSFPGVIVGFFVILTGGRQGLLANLTSALGLGRVTFAYTLVGLFVAYLYFSLPRAIANYHAAALAFDNALEEAARTLGASRWRIARDVWWPQFLPTTIGNGAIVFATAMGAFGTAFTLSTRFDVLPITIYDEFTNYTNFAVAASLSISLALLTWLVLQLARRMGNTGGGAGG